MASAVEAGKSGSQNPEESATILYTVRVQAIILVQISGDRQKTVGGFPCVSFLFYVVLLRVSCILQGREYDAEGNMRGWWQNKVKSSHILILDESSNSSEKYCGLRNY